MTNVEPDPEGHARILSEQFGSDRALRIARCYAEQLPGAYWPSVLAALEKNKANVFPAPSRREG